MSNAQRSPEQPVTATGETAVARALREAQQAAERAGRDVPMPVFLEPQGQPDDSQGKRQA